MTYRRKNTMDVGAARLLLAVFLIVALLYSVVLSCAEVKAEWIPLNEFRGIQTNATFKNIPMNRARYSVAWHFGGNGELERTTFGWKNTRPYRAGSSGIQWFAPSRYDNDIFFYNGALNIYDVSADTSRPVTLSSLDNARQYASDSVIRRNDATSSKWLYLSLSDITSIHLTSAGFDSTYQTWGGPVNDTTWFIKKAARAQYNSDPDTLTLSAATVDNTYGPPGVFLANDTTWISDGTVLIKQLGDSTAALTYPTFADTGTTGLVVGYGRYPAAGADSVMRIVDSLPDSAITAVATGRHWYQFVVDSTPRGQPVTPYYGVNNGTTDTLYFACDTSFWGQYTGAGPVSHIRLRQGAKFVVTATAPPSNWSVAWTDTGNWDYRGTINGLVKWAVWTPNNAGQHFNNIHDFDGRIMIAGGATNPPTRQNVRLFRENDTIKVLVACDLNVANNTAFRITDENAHIMKMYEWPRTSLAVSVQSWNWRISCLHKFRAFYAGNPDTLNQFAWSGDNNYDSIAGTEMLEGDGPVTALSSMDNLQVYRRHEVAQVGGSVPDEFYYMTSSSGVGAVNNATVQRDPYSTTDYFVNELGLWSNANGSVSEVPTICPEIFTDSINWQYERNFTAEIFDRKYWLSCMFGIPSDKAATEPTNNRIVVIDLDGSDVTFEGGMNIASMYVHRVPAVTSRLFVGGADSTRIMEVGSQDNLYRLSEWRSAWNDFGTPQKMKAVRRAAISYNCGANDTLYVDFYKRGSGVLNQILTSATYTKTIATTSGATGLRRTVFEVPRSIYSDVFSVGVRSSDSAMVVTDIQLDVVDMGYDKVSPR